jgi:hypothetical protein
MKFKGVNRNGTAFPADALLGMPEREIIWQHPEIAEIICLETGAVVWTRTMAYE